MGSTMNHEEPVQSEPRRRRTFGRVGAVLAFAFVCSIVGAWRFAPAAPFASLDVGADCNHGFFSPDGTVLATVGPDNGAIRIWDVAGGYERFSINPGGHGTPVFSPDGRLLAVRPWKSPITLWETATGKEYASLQPKTRENRQVPFQFSPDGRYLLYQSEGEFGERLVTFWNVQTRDNETTFEPEGGRLVDARFDYLFAPDSRTIAAFHPRKRASDNGASEVSLWRMAKPPALLKRHLLDALALAVSPDFRSFASTEYPEGGKGELALRDMETGEKRWTLPLDGDRPHPDSLWFEAGGKVLVARGEMYENDKEGCVVPFMRVTIWDVASEPKQIGTVFRERPGDRGVPAVSADGKWFAMPLPAGAKLARVSEPGRTIDLVVEDDFVPQPHAGFRWINENYASPEFLADGKLLLVYGLARPARKPFLGEWLPAWLNPFRGREETRLVRVWDVESGTQAFSFEDSSVWPSPDGSVIATHTDCQTVELWGVPFRPSIGRILGWAVAAWSIAVLFGSAAHRVLRGRWFGKH